MWFYSFYFQGRTQGNRRRKRRVVFVHWPLDFFFFFSHAGPTDFPRTWLWHIRVCLSMPPWLQWFCVTIGEVQSQEVHRLGRLESGSWATQVSDVLQHGFPGLLGGARFEWPTYHLRSMCDWKRSHFHARRRVPFTCFSPAFTLISAIHLIYSHQSPIFTHS